MGTWLSVHKRVGFHVMEYRKRWRKLSFRYLNSPLKPSWKVLPNCYSPKYFSDFSTKFFKWKVFIMKFIYARVLASQVKHSIPTDNLHRSLSKIWMWHCKLCRAIPWASCETESVNTTHCFPLFRDNLHKTLLYVNVFLF